MLVLILYDVATESEDGKSRLRKVAKICENYGLRVQNSCFECLLDMTQLVVVKNQLLQIIDNKKDSLKFYNLGNHYNNKIDSYGIKDLYQQSEPLIF